MDDLQAGAYLWLLILYVGCSSHRVLKDKLDGFRIDWIGWRPLRYNRCRHAAGLLFQKLWSGELWSEVSV